jgi:HEAT repeat protein
MKAFAAILTVALVVVLFGCWREEPRKTPEPIRPQKQPSVPGTPAGQMGNFGGLPGPNLPGANMKGRAEWKQDLQSQDPKLRLHAASALQNTEGEAEAVALAFGALLAEPDTDIRKSAVRGLLGMGRKAKPAIPALAAALSDNEPFVSGSAAEAIGHVGPDAKAAVAALTSALRNMGSWAMTGFVRDRGSDQMTFSVKGTKYVRSLAAEALGHIGPEADAAVSALEDLLKDQTAEVRGKAAEALGRIGGKAEVSIPLLIALLGDEVSSVRAHAAQALGQFGAEAEAAVPALTELLRDKASYGELLPDGVGYLQPGVGFELFTTHTVHVRDSAVDALGQIGPAAKTAVPVLTQLLDHKVGDVRRAAATVLGKIGPAAQSAAPALKKAAEDAEEEEAVRAAAARALREITPP